MATSTASQEDGVDGKVELPSIATPEIKPQEMTMESVEKEVVPDTKPEAHELESIPALTPQAQNLPRPAAPTLTPPTTTTTTAPPTTSQLQTAPETLATPTLNRTQTEALGPATDTPIAAPPIASAGPTLSISLMLTTGARHPYKIDEKYLRSRKISAANAQGEFEPRELSGYQLKELIWTDWRNEWDPRPVSPSSIRLIILGRMIDDKGTLKDFPFNLSSVNVVHMTVKPADLLDDEETAGKGGKSSTFRGRGDGEERGAGCRCVIL